MKKKTNLVILKIVAALKCVLKLINLKNDALKLSKRYSLGKTMFRL